MTGSVQGAGSTQGRARSSCHSSLEQILRKLKGYDSCNNLLMPPRDPGEKLPVEVYEYFKELKRSKEEQMKAKYLDNLGPDGEKNFVGGEPLVPATVLARLNEIPYVGPITECQMLGVQLPSACIFLLLTLKK